MKHTILGAGGSIGTPLADILIRNNQPVKLVSRSGHSIRGTESVKADLTQKDETNAAVKGSDIVYLTAGLKYDSKIWKEEWPKVIYNTIEACKSANARLIFFDNVYAYGKTEGRMKEDTPYNPCSKKGEVRAVIAQTIESEIKKGNITASIARGADLYGPYADINSVIYIMIIDNLMKGKKAMWMVNDKTIHSLSYTTDCAMGLYMLANDESSFNQVWHLPTFNPGLTGKGYIELIAAELDVNPDYTLLKKWMMKFAGWLKPVIAETYEMLYQIEYDYYFDSEKFEKHFNFSPTTYQAGIKETVDFFRNKR